MNDTNYYWFPNPYVYTPPPPIDYRLWLLIHVINWILILGGGYYWALFDDDFILFLLRKLFPTRLNYHNYVKII